MDTSDDEITLLSVGTCDDAPPPVSLSDNFTTSPTGDCVQLLGWYCVPAVKILHVGAL